MFNFHRQAPFLTQEASKPFEESMKRGVDRTLPESKRITYSFFESDKGCLCVQACIFGHLLWDDERGLGHRKEIKVGKAV